MQLTIDSVSLEYATGFRALTDVNLNLSKGLFGLLGQNGAGKSSLMRTLATLQVPTNGTILFDGMDIHEHPLQFRQLLGYLPQEFGVYPTATAEQLLTQIADLKGIDERHVRTAVVEQMLQRVNLWDVRRRAMSRFSGGMLRRFGIAQALIANPKVVIVDEPTAGLDPAERNRLYDLLAETGETAIVLLSTHLVEDVNTLCQQMVILGQGRVLVSGEPTQLIDRYHGQLWEEKIQRNQLATYQRQFPVIAHRYVSGQLMVTLLNKKPSPLGRAKTPTLEDVYFATLFTHSLPSV